MTISAPPSRVSRVRSLLFAVGMIGAALALAFLTPAYVSRDLSQRLFGIMLGVFVVAYANAVPKKLRPLVELRCDPVREQAIRRVTGWSMVLGGTGYGLAWILAPVKVAWVLAPALLATALLVAVGSYVVGMAKGRRD